MGSILSKIYDDEAEEEWRKRRKVIDELADKFAEEVRGIDTNDSSKYEEIKWFYVNRHKIMRNRRLIDLIG